MFSQKVVIVVLVVSCLSMAFVVGWALAATRNGTSGNQTALLEQARYGNEGLRVSGTAVVRAKPDLATVRLGFESRAVKSRQAKVRNDATMKKVLAALKEQGVDNSDIQTVNYRLFPVWESWPNPKVECRVWHVLHMVEVRVRQVDKVADVIDAASEAGADKIDNVEFSVDDLHKLRAQAREMAARVAREKADQLASLMDARVGRVVAIVDSNVQNYYGRRDQWNAQMVAQEENFDISPESVVRGGQVVVEAREEVVFSIEPSA